MSSEKRVAFSLLLLRLGIFVVMFIWTLDKFINPKHAAAVYEAFYGLKGMGATVMYSLATAEMALILGFVAGYKKKWTYGAVLALHAISTFSSYKQYLDPFAPSHLLFFAAWPMLAACFALFYLRDLDTRWSLDKPSL